jgi:ubiquinone/menaquinone biosynthesis C-methylase UbiE
MQLQEAMGLIQHPVLSSQGPAVWADLGCGAGLFTHALAHLLAPGSTIYAIDEDAAALRQVPEHPGITIRKQRADFTAIELPPLNGVLMANSLHYVKDKHAFLHRLPSGLLLIVEYDTDNSNAWVPYPLSFRALQKLCAAEGYTEVSKLGEHPSIYNRSNIYGALIINY